MHRLIRVHPDNFIPQNFAGERRLSDSLHLGRVSLKFLGRD
jgi:hypothetical protein